MRVDVLDIWEDAWYGESQCEWYIDHADGGKRKWPTCCGTSPVNFQEKSVPLVVKAPGSGEMGFVTVHDYLSAVHPWLMGMRGDMLAAMGTAQGDDAPLPNETELLVSVLSLESLIIDTKEDVFHKELRKNTYLYQGGTLGGPWQLGFVDISLELRICPFYFGTTFFTSGHLAMGYRSGNYRPKKTPVEQWMIKTFPDTIHI